MTYRNILVTGGCGFIGSNFINKHWEENQGTLIVNLDAMYYCAKEKIEWTLNWSQSGVFCTMLLKQAKLKLTLSRNVLLPFAKC